MKKVLLYAMTAEAAPLLETAEKRLVVSGADIGLLPDGNAVCVGGVGKVNAAMAAELLCREFSPELVIGLGVAGSLGETPAGTLVAASSCVQHDVDTTLAGDEAGFVSTVNLRSFPCALSREALALLKGAGLPAVSGVVATGDWFGRDFRRAEWIKRMFGAEVVDMEACASAQVCLRNGVPFLAVKAVSDHLFSPDQSAEYRTNIRSAVDALTSAAKILLEM
jgi:adenosylhomocysteine nucleosidase